MRGGEEGEGGGGRGRGKREGEERGKSEGRKWRKGEGRIGEEERQRREKRIERESKRTKII